MNKANNFLTMLPTLRSRHDTIAKIENLNWKNEFYTILVVGNINVVVLNSISTMRKFSFKQKYFLINSITANVLLCSCKLRKYFGKTTFIFYIRMFLLKFFKFLLLVFMKMEDFALI